MFLDIKKLVRDRKFKATFKTFLCSLLLSSTTLIVGPTNLKYLVTVEDMGEQKKFSTLKSDVNEILSSENIYISDKDELDVECSDHDMFIKISRAVDVSLIVDGKEKSFSVRPSATVLEVLQDQDVILNEHDIINFNLDKNVESGMKIYVNRIGYDLREEEQEIDFERKTEETNDLYEGEKKLKNEGSKGKLIKYYKDKIVDGNRVESQNVGEKIAKEPVAEVTLIGTKKKNLVKPKINPPKPLIGAPAAYKRVLTGVATAYSCGKSTSTGTKLARGVVAVDPKKIPYGSRLYIASTDGKYVYGYAVAADCGSAMIKGSVLVDLFMESESECLSFGRRNVNVYIL